MDRKSKNYSNPRTKSMLRQERVFNGNFINSYFILTSLSKSLVPVQSAQIRNVRKFFEGHKTRKRKLETGKVESALIFGWLTFHNFRGKWVPGAG